MHDHAYACLWQASMLKVCFKGSMDRHTDVGCPFQAMQALVNHRCLCRLHMAASSAMCAYCLPLLACSLLFMLLCISRWRGPTPNSHCRPAHSLDGPRKLRMHIAHQSTQAKACIAAGSLASNRKI